MNFIPTVLGIITGMLIFSLVQWKSCDGVYYRMEVCIEESDIPELQSIINKLTQPTAKDEADDE